MQAPKSFTYERKTELPKTNWSVFVGNPPQDLGLIDLYPTEMMFWMYLPISLPSYFGSTSTGRGLDFQLPDNLRQFERIINIVALDDLERFRDSYVYLTAKTLWVEGDYIGNRPGWHCDGFGTEDVNYIWSDRAPTEFVEGAFRVSSDCDRSMGQMEQIGAQAAALGMLTVYPDKHLLRLDKTVIHRSPVGFEPGMRTFVKVSISKDRYDLIGNSINYKLVGHTRPSVERRPARNHPASVQ